MKHNGWTAALAAVVATGLAWGGTASAAADAPRGPADEPQEIADSDTVDEIIERRVGRPALPEKTTDRSMIEEAPSGTTVVAPRSANDPLTFLNSAGDAVMEITLPVDRTRDVARTSMPGRLSFDGPGEASETVVQINDRSNASASIMAVMHSADAPTSYSYDVEVAEGAELALLESGAVEVRDTAGVEPGDDPAIAVIDPPWAEDAKGNSVGARFELDGSTLVLHVNHHGASYPVVADPDVTTNCGWTTCSIYWSRSRTRSINSWTPLLGPGGALGSFGCHYAPAGADQEACYVVAAGSHGSPITLTALGVILHSADVNYACFKITRTRGAGVPTYVSTNQGSYCTNV